MEELVQLSLALQETDAKAEADAQIAAIERLQSLMAKEARYEDAVASQEAQQRILAGLVAKEASYEDSVMYQHYLSVVQRATQMARFVNARINWLDKVKAVYQAVKTRLSNVTLLDVACVLVNHLATGQMMAKEATFIKDSNYRLNAWLNPPQQSLHSTIMAEQFEQLRDDEDAAVLADHSEDDYSDEEDSAAVPSQKYAYAWKFGYLANKSVAKAFNIPMRKADELCFTLLEQIVQAKVDIWDRLDPNNEPSNSIDWDNDVELHDPIWFEPLEA